MQSPRYEFIGWEALIEVWTPRVLGALLILVVAWAVGKAIKWGLARLIDRAPGAGRINADREPRHSFGADLGEVAFWLVLLFGVVAALGVLNLGGMVAPLNTLLNSVAGFLPNLLGAALIFFVGFVLATLARRLTIAALTAAGAERWVERAGVARATGSTGLTPALGTLVFVLIIIPVGIAALEQLGVDTITQPAVSVLTMVLAALPRVLAAAIVLAIGWFIGRWVASLIERILPATGFDRSLSGLTTFAASARTTSTLSAGEAAAPTAPPLTPSRVVAGIALFAIVAFSAIEAARLVDFGAAAGIIESILELAARVLFGAVIITVGVILADILAGLAARATGPGNRFASTLVRWTTIALAVAMGLSFMGIADEIVVLAFGLILGSAAVAAALAFGLGGREWAGRMLQRWTETAPSPAAPRPRTPRRPPSTDTV